MNYQSISDIYAGNEKIRARLKGLVSNLGPEQIAALPDGEKWTIQQIVEHIAIVDESTMKICSKLLKKAEEAGQTGDGRVNISDGFIEKGRKIGSMKVEAPSFVQPTGEKTIADSFARLDETAARLDGMRKLFESVDSTAFKFPHPFFGEISAEEWLALKGGHEMRHIKQIERIAEKLK